MQVTSFNTKQHQAGFSLLELLLVVAVGAVLILAGLGAYKLVSENNAGTQGLRQLQSLKSQIQEAYQGAAYPTAAGDLTDQLAQMRKFPPDMVYTAATNTATNAFGGTTTAVGTATGFTITFDGVPPNACGKMGIAFQQTSSSDFTGVAINGGANRANPTVANVAADCSLNTNSLVFSFR